MNAPPLPEVLLGDTLPEQSALPLATEGVLRTFWQSRYGPIFIEVRDGSVFVDGQRVQPIAELRETLGLVGR